MWENMTFENILNDMLSRVNSDVDKREGSIIYDALAPAAYQLAQMYFMMGAFIDLVFGDTAVEEYLDRVVKDHGINRKNAVNAVRIIESSGEIEIGTRWGIKGLTYTISQKISENKYKGICATAGEIGNQYNGPLENIDHVSGVTAQITEILIAGQDEESDDNLRNRFYSYIQKPATSGNSSHYRQWAMDVPGIGDAKVFPLWNGPGTVKVVIVDSNKHPVTETTIQHVTDHVEAVRPIGALVTVVSATAKTIDISVAVILAPGYNLQMISDAFKKALEDYFKSIAFSLSYISHAKIGNILLGVEGVLDYNGLLINGSSINIPLTEEEIPVIGTVDVEV